MEGSAFGEQPRRHEDPLWFSDWGPPEVIAVDVAGNHEAMLQAPSFPCCVDWLPDGRLLLVSAREGRLLRQEPGGSLVTHGDLSGPSKPAAGNELVVDGRGNAYVNGGGFDLMAGEPFAPGIVALVTPLGTVRRPGRALDPILRRPPCRLDTACRWWSHSGWAAQPVTCGAAHPWAGSLGSGDVASWGSPLPTLRRTHAWSHRSGARLVTLTGPGGAGKTRLAVAVGVRLRDRFGAGTVFVPLDTVADPGMALAAVGRMAGADLARTGSPLEALAETFSDGKHLENIYTRLGVSSRTAAVTRAFPHGANARWPVPADMPSARW
jgi:hypothetical protein